MYFLPTAFFDFLAFGWPSPSLVVMDRINLWNGGCCLSRRPSDTACRQRDERARSCSDNWANWFSLAVMSADVGLDSGHSVFPSVVISSLIVSNRHLTIDQSKIQQSTRLNKNFKKKSRWFVLKMWNIFLTNRKIRDYWSRNLSYLRMRNSGRWRE